MYPRRHRVLLLSASVRTCVLRQQRGRAHRHIMYTLCARCWGRGWCGSTAFVCVRLPSAPAAGSVDTTVGGVASRRGATRHATFPRHAEATRASRSPRCERMRMRVPGSINPHTVWPRGSIHSPLIACAKVFGQEVERLVQGFRGERARASWADLAGAAALARWRRGIFNNPLCFGWLIVRATPDSTWRCQSSESSADSLAIRVKFSGVVGGGVGVGVGVISAVECTRSAVFKGPPATSQRANR